MPYETFEIGIGRKLSEVYVALLKSATLCDERIIRVIVTDLCDAVTERQRFCYVENTALSVFAACVVVSHGILSVSGILSNKRFRQKFQVRCCRQSSVRRLKREKL